MESDMALSDPVPAAVTYFFLFVLFGWIFFILSWNFGFENTCNTAYSLVQSILRCLFCITKCVLKKVWETIMDLFVSVTTKKKVTPATIVIPISVAIPTEVVETSPQPEPSFIGGVLLIGCLVVLVTATVVPWLSTFT
jgi:hypothetical protein